MRTTAWNGSGGERNEKKTNAPNAKCGASNEEEKRAMSKGDFIEEFAPVPSGHPADSQSPRAHREEAGEFTRDVSDSARYGQRISPENRGAEKIDSDLSIESINNRAYKPRRG
jgi:hypothetical protein